MNRASVIAKLKETALHLGSLAAGTEWHLFGSTNRDEANPSDIDLMIFCCDDNQADELRKAINPTMFGLPLHLSLFTFEEANSINVSSIQNSTEIITLDSTETDK
jgi:predicted nucleotidyltransferase